MDHQQKDETAVAYLATAMNTKLARARAKGRSGWDSPECTQQHLSDLLRGHVEKGDPVDVANFCAFLAARGEGITPRQCLAQIEEPAQPVLYVSPGQLANHSNPEGPESEKAGRYLPARKTPAGKFTQPLYAGAAPAAVAPWPQGEYPPINPKDFGSDSDLWCYIDAWHHAAPGEASGEKCQWLESHIQRLMRAYFDLGRQQEACAPGLTDGQLENESYRVNDEPGFSDAFRAGARFAERVHGVTAAAARALTGEADWWRGRADEIEAQVARSGSKEAMRCYTDMRTLLQAAAPALEAPAAPVTSAQVQALHRARRALHAIGKTYDDSELRTRALEADEEIDRMLAAAPQTPAQEAPAATALAAEFTDQSIADPVEKARRYLKAMADEAPNSVYFFDDGYPRRASSQDAKAALVVLEQLAARAPAPQAPAAPAGDVRVAIEKLPRYTYGYKSDEWGMNSHLTSYKAEDGKFLRRDDVLSAIAAQAKGDAAPAVDALDADRWRAFEGQMDAGRVSLTVHHTEAEQWDGRTISDAGELQDYADSLAAQAAAKGEHGNG